MLPLRRPLVSLLAVATTMLALTSCTGDDKPACVDGVVELGTGLDLELDDDCELVRISGTDTTVVISGIDVEQVEINGDRNLVEADELEAVRISGQENRVEAARLGAVDIRGDRDVISAEGEVGSIAIHGNDNDATADTFGDVSDNGDRNSFSEISEAS